jgi:hypothetical protein
MKNDWGRNYIETTGFLNKFSTVCSILVPFVLFCYGYFLSAKRGWPLHSKIPFIIGICTIIFHVMYLNAKPENNLNALQAEIRDIIQLKSAWSIGSALGCIMIAGYFLFPSLDKNLANRYQGALGLYLSALGTTLAISKLYTLYSSNY